MTILNNHSNINISPELHILEPFWLHTDFKRTIDQKIGSLNDRSNVRKLVDLMYSRTFSGSFWNLINIDKATLLNDLHHSDRAIKTIFKILLENDAKLKKKSRIGAKFPVHFSYIGTLIKWFPKCKIVHITRDPRAIYASQSTKLNNKVYNPMKRIVNHVLTFVYINWDYWRSARMHTKYRFQANYYLSRYEDIVSDPQKFLPQLCDFIDTGYTDAMLRPPVRDSSFSAHKQIGFNTHSIDRWRQSINPVTASLIRLLNYPSMKELGYN